MVAGQQKSVLFIEVSSFHNRVILTLCHVGVDVTVQVVIGASIFDFIVKIATEEIKVRWCDNHVTTDLGHVIYRVKELILDPCTNLMEEWLEM